MRTGADYRQSLRDGRRVWVMGEGQVEDVTTHPATHAMVEEYAAWYDRHLDPAWQDLLLTPPNADRERIPLAYVMPKSAEDLTRMGRSFAKTTFLSAGNITQVDRGGAAAASIQASKQVILAANGNRPVILPISGRRSRSIIAGTHFMGAAFAANMSSGAPAAMSSMSR